MELYEPSQLINRIEKSQKIIKDYSIEKVIKQESAGPREGQRKMIFGRPAVFSGGRWQIEDKKEEEGAPAGAAPLPSGAAPPPAVPGAGAPPPAASGAPQVPIPTGAEPAGPKVEYIPPERTPVHVGEPKLGPEIPMRSVHEIQTTRPEGTLTPPAETTRPEGRVTPPAETTRPEGKLTPPAIGERKRDRLSEQLAPRLGFRPQRLRGAPTDIGTSDRPEELGTVMLPIAQRKPRYLREKFTPLRT